MCTLLLAGPLLFLDVFLTMDDSDGVSSHVSLTPFRGSGGAFTSSAFGASCEYGSG